MDNEGGANSSNIGESGPVKGHLPSKLDSDSGQRTQYTCHNPAIDVTDGQWHALPLANHYEASFDTSPVIGKGNTATYAVSSLFGLKFNDILGITAFGQPTGDSTDINANLIYGLANVSRYAFIRPKSVQIELSNFLVTVERDTSGGIQFKDDIRFEVQAMPVTDLRSTGLDVFTENYLTNYPSTSFITDFTKGLKAYTGFRSGFFPSDYCRVYMQHSGTQNVGRIYYPSIYEWISNTIEEREATDTTWSSEPPPYWGNPQLTAPVYLYFIRAINVPLGLSNIKVYLSYSSTVTCISEVQCFMQLLSTVWQEGEDASIPTPAQKRNMKSLKRRYKKKTNYMVT